MQYLGGKSRIAKRLAEVVNAIRGPRPFWEPFCGGLSMSVALGGRGIVSDAHPALISLYQAVMAGWDPPESLSEEEYRSARALHDGDPRKAFAGFGCSFGGKWFGGYARSTGRDFASSCRRVLLEQIDDIRSRGCAIQQINFLSIEPHPTDLVLYLDPPYRGTTGYSLQFDHEVFYRRVSGWARHTTVFVSESAMPWGRVAMEFKHSMSVAGGHQPDARTERLYRYGPDRMLDAVMR